MKNKEAFDLILNEKEKQEIQRFVDNESQREAVKKVLLFEIYGNGILTPGLPADPSRNFLLDIVVTASEQNLSKDQMAGKLEAVWAAVRMLEMGFNNLFIYSKPDVPLREPKKNPAI